MSVAPECPCCGVRNETTSRRIATCAACGHSWLPTSADEQRRVERSIYVRNYPGYNRDSRLDESFDRLIAEELRPAMPAGGKILDVGCGGGAFLDAAQRAGLDVRGLDVSPDAAQLCRERGHDAVAGDFLGYGEPGSFAAVTFWDVLEHLREPLAFLERAAVLLAPGGVLLAKVPTFGKLTVALVRRVPRAGGALLGAPDHVQYYTLKSLDALFARSPLQARIEAMAKAGMRTPPSGGSARKRVARQVKAGIAQLSGDSNAMVVATT